MNIAFYVSGNATRLKRFLSNHINDITDTKIAFVLIDNTNNSELRDICSMHNITLLEKDLNHLKNRNSAVSDLLLSNLDKYKCNYAFIFANKILVGDLLLKYKNKLINFHPSILPSFKGLNAIDRALTDKAFLLGNSAHFVTPELDAGSVIIQHIIHHSNYRNYDGILDMQLIMLLQIISWLGKDRVYVKNGYALVKGADYSIGEYTPKIELDAHTLRELTTKK